MLKQIRLLVIDNIEKQRKKIASILPPSNPPPKCSQLHIWDQANVKPVVMNVIMKMAEMPLLKSSLVLFQSAHQQDTGVRSKARNPESPVQDVGILSNLLAVMSKHTPENQYLFNLTCGNVSSSIITILKTLHLHFLTYLSEVTHQFTVGGLGGTLFCHMVNQKCSPPLPPIPQNLKVLCQQTSSIYFWGTSSIFPRNLLQLSKQIIKILFMQ